VPAPRVAGHAAVQEHDATRPQPAHQRSHQLLDGKVVGREGTGRGVELGTMAPTQFPVLPADLDGHEEAGFGDAHC
jgi:hypothetical protein